MADEKGVRGTIRQKWLSKAQDECKPINSKLGNDRYDLHRGRRNGTAKMWDSYYGFGLQVVLAVLGVILGFGAGASSGSALFGLILAVAGLIGGDWLAVTIYNAINEGHNSDIDARIAALEAEAKKQCAAIYAKYNKEADREIAAYDARVQQRIAKAQSNSSYLDRMVTFLVSKFEEQLAARQWIASNAEADVVVDFGFRVTFTELEFYDGKNWHSKVYVFHKERYADLHSTEECEAMAQVLSKLLLSKLKAKYKSQHATMKVTDQLDGTVKRRFTMPNKNFTPATNIF